MNGKKKVVDFFFNGSGFNYKIVVKICVINCGLTITPLINMNSHYVDLWW